MLPLRPRLAVFPMVEVAELSRTGVEVEVAGGGEIARFASPTPPPPPRKLEAESSLVDSVVALGDEV